ncbi:hypothetical protein BIW11_04230 [Tropilaelaps mercedesae]|uniref:Uncharacterized protein n=1 Tax=Tropilaelaps mercedesae TaxID=418985 RepID=A0A1V9X935_9ACAR|nr:hypothetical protein BIW11_04230 [Tropilaelaps mercedesae]
MWLNLHVRFTDDVTDRLAQSLPKKSSQCSKSRRLGKAELVPSNTR